MVRNSPLGLLSSKCKVNRKEVVAQTIRNYLKSLHTFLQINDFPDGKLNWRKNKSWSSTSEDAADDGPLSREETKKL